ncbi:MAG: HDIG domain-containing protein [Candidatus Azobacteroides sp.]|nr:HDIG domain-containing protein [Candidatus Azobacteroides sp.]
MDKKSFAMPKYIYFIIVGLLVLFFFPREGKFSYSFIEGRPWRYGLLIAPFDFPIYKTDAEIKTEQDSVETQSFPYFQWDEEVANRQIQQFNENFKPFYAVPHALDYKKYLDEMLTKIYNIGIISANDYQYLQDHHYTHLMILRNNLAEPHAVKEFFTIRTAYSFLWDNCPPYLNTNELNKLMPDNYLRENMAYDEAMTEKVKQELLRKISPSNGMVQAGEKIVDRGEIIDGTIYNILRSLKINYDKQAGTVNRQVGLWAGTVIIVGGLIACYFFYFYYFRKNIYANRKDIIFSLFIVTFFTLLTEISITYDPFSIYIIPYAIIPIIVRTFFDSRTAQATHLVTILICSLLVPLSFEFVLMQLIVCWVALYVLKDLSQRSELMKCALWIFAAYFSVYFGLLLFQEGNFSKINERMLICFGINFLFVLFTYPFIYILEKVFGYISNITLVELSDINSGILVELSETCPGTFQHSLQVSMLGVAAAAKIGANSQLVRTGALYHDVGKMANPHFFIENKIEGHDPHENLSLEQSARIITGHVPEGVKIAGKNNLPQAIVKFIRTHHGKGKARYFYNSFRNQFPDAVIDEEAFTYDGDNPDTKETAILMMADSVEAASRSLKDYTEESIRNLVNRIVDMQIAEGLLSEAPLTFKNITDIKAVFVERLLSVYHSRVIYPELEKK